jgi:hypothetical protein
MEIGIVSYYSGVKIVDFAGLVTDDVMRAVAEGDRRFAIEQRRPEYVVARYPAPLALEGGLTEGDLAAGYKLLYGADGVGVFEAVRPLQDERDFSRAADLLNVHPGTVFIPRQRVDSALADALDRAVAPHGSMFVRTLSGEGRDFGSKRFAYVSFREGHVDAVEPMLEDYDIGTFAVLPRFDFDEPRERLDEWNAVTIRGSSESALHLTTESNKAYVSVPTDPFAPWLAGHLRVRYRVREATDCANGKAQGGFFWITEEDRAWGLHGKFIPFSVDTSGDWSNLDIDLSENPEWNGSGIVQALRYDPVCCLATLDIDYFRLE